MARIRTVKPDLFRHGGLYDLEKETGLPIRLCFIALFTCCDREGRFKWRPRELKLDCIPYDDIDFSRVLDALTTRGFVVKYSKNKQVYGCIPTFSDHQVINNREKDSLIPDYLECIRQVIDNYEELTRESRVGDASTTPLEEDQGEGKGRERKGKEGNGNNIGDKSFSPKNAFSDEDNRCAEFIFSKIRELNPTAKPPNMKKWAESVRLMRERDNRTHREIIELFTWANNDQFWKTNILSPQKLREKWDSLVIKKNNQPKTMDVGDHNRQAVEEAKRLRQLRAER